MREVLTFAVYVMASRVVDSIGLDWFGKTTMQAAWFLLWWCGFFLHYYDRTKGGEGSV